MKAMLLSLIAATMLIFAVPTQADAYPYRYYRWGPRPYYRAQYGAYPYRAYRPYVGPPVRPYYRPYAYRYWGPGYYYGPSVSIGVY